VKRIALVLLACASLLSGQTRKPTSSKLISIKVTGSTRYSPEQIIAATGLKLGQTVNDEDFKGVSQHLGETGAFTDVAYSFEFSAAGIKLALQVKDTNPFVPVHFENFVWLSDQELADKLRTREPLFQGQLPASGNLVDQLSETLQGIAIEHNIHGRVDYLRAGPQDGPIEAFEFSVTGAPITISKVSFSGAGAAELPLLTAAAHKISGQEYSRSRLTLEADKNFLPVFLQHGYLKASLGPPQPKVSEETAEETQVEVAFAVTPGLQYKLSGIQLSGNTNIFPAETLRGSIHLQPGESANAVQADQDAEALKKLYGTRGYMGIQIQPTPETHDADSTVTYVFKFQEGSIYKMGDLEVRGLDSKATERINVAWRLLPGQTYDSGYPQLFLDSIVGQYPPDLWKITVRETPEDQDKIVDISLRFDSKR
jgi:outer membrane protein assembly factor BamA